MREYRAILARTVFLTDFDMNYLTSLLMYVLGHVLLKRRTMSVWIRG